MNNPRFMMGGGGGGLGRSRSLNSPRPDEKIDKKTKSRILLRLGGYMLQHKWLVMLAAGLMVASNLLALMDQSCRVWRLTRWLRGQGGSA